MPSPSELPRAAVRDLLGIARAMHKAWRVNGWPIAEVKELELIGHDLLEALDLSHRSEPGMVEYERACELAETASDRLTAMIACSPTRLAPVVSVAAERMKRQRRSG